MRKGPAGAIRPGLGLIAQRNPPGQTAQLHRALERSVVRSVPTAGHMVHHAAPVRLLDTVELIFAWPKIHAEPIHSLR